MAGGGDSACDWALTLQPIARSVTLVHRRATFRAHAHSVSQLLSSPVEVITDAEITRVTGPEHVESVEVTTSAWGLGLNANRFLAVNSAMSTTVPGVLAAGDITDYPGKVHLISVGFGEAVTAVNNAAVLIRPDEQLFPGHSSDGVPAVA